MKIIHISRAATETDVRHEDHIHLFTQFYLPTDPQRRHEIVTCLRRNAALPCVTTVHLLNERIYTADELGVNSSKIVQTDLGHRLHFDDVFYYARTRGLTGYFVLSNADIFFDADTLVNLYATPLATKKSAMAQLRYEYRGETDLATCPLFGPRFDSQDTWILHANFAPTASQERAFHIAFGRPGCDNRVAYLWMILGYEVFNDPACVKTYHHHASPQRSYNANDVIGVPWAAVAPFGFPPTALPPSLGINLSDIAAAQQTVGFGDNDILRTYVARKLAANETFIVPRIAGIENNVAVFAQLQVAHAYITNVTGAMKNNAGIRFTSPASVNAYSRAYLTAFHHAELMCGWDLQGNYIGHIRDSHRWMRDTFATKQMIWALGLDVFHYIHAQPWTQALRGRRILLVTSMVESMREKIPIRHLLWGDSGVDLFPDCTFVLIAPPVTQAEEPAEDFQVELAKFYVRLDALRDTYDVALVSAGGYGNLICAHLFSQGKSSVYVGGVLQMYFGVLGNRWLKERPDVLRLYLNAHWSRPSVAERPRGCETIEGACYW